MGAVVKWSPPLNPFPNMTYTARSVPCHWGNISSLCVETQELKCDAGGLQTAFGCYVFQVRAEYSGQHSLNNTLDVTVQAPVLKMGKLSTFFSQVSYIIRYWTEGYEDSTEKRISTSSDEDVKLSIRDLHSWSRYCVEAVVLPKDYTNQRLYSQPKCVTNIPVLLSCGVAAAVLLPVMILLSWLAYKVYRFLYPKTKLPEHLKNLFASSFWSGEEMHHPFDQKEKHDNICAVSEEQQQCEDLNERSRISEDEQAEPLSALNPMQEMEEEYKLLAHTQDSTIFYRNQLYPLCQENRLFTESDQPADRVFAQLKKNNVVQAEPSELHFRGFEVGKEYKKLLKLVNISSDVLSIHILPPMTQHFQIKYSKKCRLVPGLAYTITVLFRPDGWHYFSDNIRVHGEGEENLLVPVFAYPCYGTADITLQLTISQFNSKPVVWTVTGSSSSYLLLNKPEESGNCAGEQMTTGGKPSLFASQYKLNRFPFRDKSSSKKSKPDGRLLASSTDVTTHAGLEDKMRFKDPRATISCAKIEEQTQDLGEAAFLKKDQQNEEKSRQDGHDPASKQQKRKEYEMALAAFKLKYSDECVSRSSMKVIKFPECTGSGHLEVRPRALRIFQQAAHKVLCRCRMNKRLESLRELVHKTKKAQDKGQNGDKQPCLFNLTPDRIGPVCFDTYHSEEEWGELAVDALGAAPVGMPEVDLKLTTPLFTLKVPEHYKLMGYQSFPVYEAAASFVPSDLCRPLRRGAEDELLPAVMCASVNLHEDEEDKTPVEDDASDHDLCAPTLNFKAPDAILHPPNAHPLRIFNPAPHVNAFKSAPLYLETEPEIHLCPLPRYPSTKGSSAGVQDSSTQRRFLDRKDIIKGIMTWKKFPPPTLSTLSNIPTLKSEGVPFLTDPFSLYMLPVEVPPVLPDLPDNLKPHIQTGRSSSLELCLTPEMVEAEFVLPHSSVEKSFKEKNDTSRLRCTAARVGTEQISIWSVDSAEIIKFHRELQIFLTRK
ncbi:hypothetical protein DNTS_000083 [Danionella cerebrum]|uniref:Interferon/interleukin receptor domain-containing protein n=1 Tax=Danionella cerebrum TaxID=2873325 RepID=A0A553RK03_9TELE|nr:hypothetical protein DNTS_000083 [Danionella translucida]